VKGKVKFFRKQKGFGFIVADGKDYFFHATALINLYDPKDDDLVTFDVSQTERGLKAINVQSANGIQ